MIEKKFSACLQFLRRPERYNKLLLSRVGEDEGKQGEEAESKEATELKRWNQNSGRESPWGGGGLAGGGGGPGPVNAGAERAAGESWARSGRAPGAVPLRRAARAG